MKELSFDVTGGEKRIEYTVNCDNAEIGAVASASWVQVSVSSSLFTITVSENTSADRRAYIIPTLNGEYCDTTANKLSVFQKGVSTGCSVTLVITGLENKDKATIDWGDETTSEDKRNGTYRHRYTSGDEHTFTVTAEGYDTATGTFICGSVTSLTIDMSSTVGCPESGGTSDWTGVVFIGDHQIDGDANDEVGILAFKTGHTAFSSVDAPTCDGTVVTAATWTTEGGETPPGWKRITVSHGANPSTSSTRSGSVTVTMTKTDGDDCTYIVYLTQKAGSQPTTTCSVTFRVTNSTTRDVNGSVEVFWGTGLGRSFHFDVDGLSPGSSKNITKTLSEECGQEINTAQFESPSLNTPMNVHGSRMLNDGTTVNLEIPNSF